MNNYFCVTHYHIWQAIAHKTNHSKKGRLIITAGFTAFDDELINNIKNEEVFEEVILFDVNLLTKEMPRKWYRKFKKVEEIKERYENFMEKYFGFIEDDEKIFLFSPRHWINWYFYDKGFYITKFEDGYCNFNAEMLNTSKTINQEILELAYEISKEEILLNEKIPVISSVPITIKKNIIVKDFKENFKNSVFVDIITKIYEYLNLSSISTDILFLSQPIFKNEKDALKFIKILSNEFPRQKILIKNHPACNYNYSKLKLENVSLIDKAFPIELLNFFNNDIQAIVSVCSTATDLLSIDADIIKIIDNQQFSTKQIQDKVIEFIKNNKIIINQK